VFFEAADGYSSGGFGGGGTANYVGNVRKTLLDKVLSDFIVYIYFLLFIFSAIYKGDRVALLRIFSSENLPTQYAHLSVF
jgi:hypothetical protein